MRGAGSRHGSNGSGSGNPVGWCLATQQSTMGRKPGRWFGQQGVPMLKDKVALVTGGASGIGRAVALAWGREGARVVVSDVDRDGGEETAEAVRAAGSEALFAAADVGKPEDCEALVQRAVQKFGRLDIACNN